MLPALLIVKGAAGASLAVALPILAGELIDRLEFYDGLRFVTPSATMRDHLAVRIAGLAKR